MNTEFDEMIGKELDFWVAKAEGLNPAAVDGLGRVCYAVDHGKGFEVRPYSTHWEFAGPIIERENIMIDPPTSRVHRNGGPNAGWGASGVWSACTWHRGANGKRAIAHHETSPLIAAMRCYVESKLAAQVANKPSAAQTNDTKGA